MIAFLFPIIVCEFVNIKVTKCTHYFVMYLNFMVVDFGHKGNSVLSTIKGTIHYTRSLYRHTTRIVINTGTFLEGKSANTRSQASF